MPQKYTIKTFGKTYHILAPDGMEQEQVLSVAAATDPEFAQEYARSQSRQSLANRVGKDEASDTQFSKELTGGFDAKLPFASASRNFQAKPVDIKALTNAVGPIVGAGLGIKSLASRVAPRVLRGPGASGEVSVNPATMAARELEARVPRSAPPTARDEMYTDLGTRLQKRGAEQAKLDKATPPAPISPFPGATSTGMPSMPPPASAQTPLQPQTQPLASRTAARAPAGSLSRRIIIPGERTDPMPVEGAGSAAQATEADLRRLAAAGDQSATIELARRRLPMGPTDYSKVPLPRGMEPLE